MENLLFLGVPILKHIRVNIVNPVQTLHSAASELGLHYLLVGWLVVLGLTAL